MLLHLPMRLLAAIRQRAALGDTSSTSSEEALAGGSPRPTLVSMVQAFAQSGRATVVDMAAAGDADADMFGAAAAGGNGQGDGALALNAAAFSQLLLDMHRQAGIMLLDRMGHYLASLLADHVMTALQVRPVAVHPCRCCHLILIILQLEHLHGLCHPCRGVLLIGVLPSVAAVWIS
jgi:hypothetical protein